MRAFCHFKAWEFTSESGLVNMLPAKAIEERHVQHKAIQHSNALSLGSHFNHSLFSATVPAGCKLCGAVINPCRVREEGGKTNGNELKYEVPLMIALPPTHTHFTHTHVPVLYCFTFMKEIWDPQGAGALLQYFHVSKAC